MSKSALEGAWQKGARAREAGEPRSANPYKDTRKMDGRLTWSRAFWRAWDDGWNRLDFHGKPLKEYVEMSEQNSEKKRAGFSYAMTKEAWMSNKIVSEMLAGIISKAVGDIFDKMDTNIVKIRVDVESDEEVKGGTDKC